LKTPITGNGRKEGRKKEAWEAERGKSLSLPWYSQYREEPDTK
jgi:hypothetical protein